MNIKTKKKIDSEIVELSKEQKRRIKYKQEYQGKEYKVLIEIPKTMEVSVWLAEDLFYNELKKKPYRFNDKCSYYDNEKKKLITVLNVEQITLKTSIFKRF